MSDKLIDQIELPAGLRALNHEQLKQISRELRDELIDCVSNSGGHFASSLGATEITVAIHHMFNTPDDRLVWDVGHQGYIHKMLTGRRDQLSSIRKKGGISGFLKRSESPFDNFGAGHAGTSISAAVGMAVSLREKARREGTEPRYVVSVIGDGSITAGMAFEALNHAGDLGLKNFIVILNDNEMSISPNVGAISWLFSRAITSKTSNLARSNFKSLYRKGYVPELVYKALDRAEEAAQGFFASPSMLFESFGFRYLGPVDGHSIDDLTKAIEHAKTQDVPVLIHARTVKGKGYEPAEEDPITWHGVNPFDREKGQFLAKVSNNKKAPTYTAVFADTLTELAGKDEKVIAITAAMAGGTGLDKFQAAYPERFYDVGICEQHAVTFAAGLACEGMRPVCAIYSTFLQRGYDQVVHDVCVQDLPVLFCMDRGGLVGNDGETHQGCFDISFLRTLPHMVLMSPKDENELRDMIYTALQHNGPVGLRYPRGNGVGVEIGPDYKQIPIGKAEIVLSPNDSKRDVLIIAYGPQTYAAIAVAQRLQIDLGLGVQVINARFAKPLDIEMLSREIPRFDLVCTLEDHALEGGFGSAILECINDHGIALNSFVQRFGIADEFVTHASQDEQYQMNSFDQQSIYSSIRSYFESKKRAKVVGV